MLATFDATAVRHFIADLNTQRVTCNDDSSFCSDLDEVLGCHLEHCTRLREAVNEWAAAVFTGRASFDPAVEAMFKNALRTARQRATPHVVHGYEVKNECFDLDRLQYLNYCLGDIDFLLSNWVSPERSVAPSPRVEPTDETVRQVKERIEDLPPLPPGWRCACFLA